MSNFEDRFCVSSVDVLRVCLVSGVSQVRSSRPLSVGHRGHPSDAVTAGKQSKGVVAGVGQRSERTKRRTTHSAPGRSQVRYN